MKTQVYVSPNITFVPTSLNITSLALLLFQNLQIQASRVLRSLLLNKHNNFYVVYKVVDITSGPKSRNPGFENFEKIYFALSSRNPGFMNVVNITTVPKSRNLGFEHLGNMGFVSKSTSPGFENVVNIPFVKKKTEIYVVSISEVYLLFPNLQF